MTDNNQIRQLEAIVSIAQMITTLKVDEVLQGIIQLTMETVRATKGSFFLLDEQKGKLKHFLAARDLDRHEADYVSTRIMEQGLVSWVIANKQSALVHDTAVDPRWLVLDDALRVRSAICVPFFFEEQLRGVMTLEHPTPNHFSDNDLRLAEITVNQAGTAIRNAELFKYSQDQQRQLEGVLDSISDALLVVDEEWRIKILNPAAKHLVGRAFNEITARRLDQIDDPFFSQLVEGIYLNDQGAGGLLQFDLRAERTHRDYIVNVRPLMETDNSGIQRNTGYVIALSDVTALKDLTRLKTHMIQMASHDLKNPLGVLIGYLDLLAGDIQRGIIPDLVFVENMQRVVTRMETLVATLLDTQRVGTENVLKRQLLDPYTLLDQVLADHEENTRKHQHTLIKDIAPNLRSIRGNAIELQEAMSNLLSNAIKYTPDGGTITVTVYTDEDRFYFRVADTGCGIPDDQQKQVFQPYFRSKQKETEHISGTGVGLSLVKDVVERHGGYIWFTSKLQQGSVFSFWLPLLG